MSDALLANIVRFAATLRAAGIPVGVDQVASLSRALMWIDLGDRHLVFMVARALFVSRREDLVPFRVLFNRFWSAREAEGRGGQVARRRLRVARPPERFTIVNYMAQRASASGDELDVADRAGSYSDADLLRTKRFAEMTTEELEEVGRLVTEMRWDVARRATRRRTPDATGSDIDFRRTVRHTGRLGALPAVLPRLDRKEKDRPLVLLADVSGSMEKYSRLILQFFHATMRGREGVEAFVFASRLTRITPQLRIRNLDRAIAEAARDVSDWAGGTRIGECLGTFNRGWSRRVLGRGAVVAILSDGCDRGDVTSLARELRFLGRRCHRLIWLNPYSGHPDYRPEVSGMAAALDAVDDFLPMDDLTSLMDLAKALESLRGGARRRWRVRRTGRTLPSPQKVRPTRGRRTRDPGRSA